MKRIFTLGFLVLCVFATTHGQQTVYGGDFEHWKYMSCCNYYNPDSSLFSTLDTLTTVPTPSGITAYPCDTAYRGNHSVRVVSSMIDLMQVLIPGVIGTIHIDWTTLNGIIGIPYPYGTTKPIRFSGYYKSYPVNNDSSAAVLLLSKWNSTSIPNRRDTLAYNRLVFHGTVNDWTLFDTAVTYRDQSKTPDSLTVLLTSCGGFNAAHMLACVGRVGSTALYDDVNLTDVSGFPLLLMPSVGVKLSPNPANDFINLLVAEPVSNGYFEVYDTQAKLIQRFPVNGTSGKINVSDLSSGMYYYKLMKRNKLLNSGTFAITK